MVTMEKPGAKLARMFLPKWQPRDRSPTGIGPAIAAIAS